MCVIYFVKIKIENKNLLIKNFCALIIYLFIFCFIIYYRIMKSVIVLLCLVASIQQFSTLKSGSTDYEGKMLRNKVLFLSLTRKLFIDY